MRDDVLEWLRFANADRRAARRLIAGQDPLIGPAAYHVQQAAEKIVKGLIIWHGIEPTRTHDLDRLLRLLPETDPAYDTIDRLHSVTEWAVSFRYPTEAVTETPSVNRVLIMLALVDEVYDTVMGRAASQG